MSETIVCPVGYSCEKLIPVGDVFLLFGGIALVIVAIAFAVWLVSR